MNTTALEPFPVLGIAELDDAHRALHRQLACLSCLPLSLFVIAFDEVVAGLERDFREEEELMERIAYAGLPCHREQHARALAGLHHAAAALAEGHEEPARRAVTLLAEWFAFHISTMDQALAVACQSVHRCRSSLR